MSTLESDLEGLAESRDFSGIVTVHRAGECVVRVGRGLADRSHGVPIGPSTRFALASGTKGVTALTVVALVERGELAFDTRARELLGTDLPDVADEVTVEHLLAHTSGIGDYLDEEELDDHDAYVLDVAPHLLAAPRDYLTVLHGHAQRTLPGATFAYNNSGYVLLAVLTELATSRCYYDLVDELVLEPAGMASTSFLRYDELPGDVARGYVVSDTGAGAGLRSNVLHLPVRGAGDGGLFSPPDDVDRLWRALYEGRIVDPGWVATMTEPRGRDSPDGDRYGLGFWLRPDRPTPLLEGMDAGISFRTGFDPASRTTYVVMANTSTGAWPLAALLDDRWDELIS